MLPRGSVATHDSPVLDIHLKHERAFSADSGRAMTAHSNKLLFIIPEAMSPGQQEFDAAPGEFSVLFPGDSSPRCAPIPDADASLPDNDGSVPVFIHGQTSPLTVVAFAEQVHAIIGAAAEKI